ncbi:Signal transduction histidine kinase [Peptoclostridium litorale DSM 5388]|uniref:histidine kinase n=1 Tax=Peptoclostridium litorale DSM 5388 TaxID=1121324 RepID=A0A069RCH3_PEPLI|nr:HAMP domain-containing sensor histidine kinase [Peptoclostridium litorale]KDR94721.1 sensor protein GtcS [Peptoclostridium litorale DSM 5388]SIO33121.1 Signal transduction histidine kinase [Peptoclostridium litorale DSM 5388]
MSKRKFWIFDKISISTQFFLNYMVLFFLLILIIAATSYIGFLYIDRHVELYSVDMEKLSDDIHSMGIYSACAKHGIPEDSYVEILDNNFKITDSYNSIHTTGYKYPRDDFIDLLLSNNPDFQFYNCIQCQTLLLFATPGYTEGIGIEKLMGLLLKTFMLSLVLVMLIYARLTSIIILHPIQKLLDGVRKISAGDYSAKIDFSSRNELGDLKNAINHMSQKIQSETELREMSEENRKKLILYISHDLRTPLTNVLGYCETIKSEKDIANETREKYLDIIISSAQRADRLIQDLFELSKIANDSDSSTFKTLDICEVLRETLINFIPELEQNEMEYEFEIPEKLILCRVNPQKLERAFGNIIHNSIKYSGRGTKLMLSIKHVDDSVFITIKDNGGGLSSDFTCDIFEPFIRGEQSRNSKTGGTGLGLAITKRIIESHSGRIIIDKSYKIGCKFIILLPVAGLGE